MPPICDVSEIRALLGTDRPWAVYALGDLSPVHFGHCSWFAAPGATPALALLYRGFTPPVLLTLGPPDALRPVLDEIAHVPEFFLHVREEVLPLIETRYQVRHRKAMWRMLLDPAAFRPAATADVVGLGLADLEALQRLYADGEPAGESPEFFGPSMLQDGTYRGVYEDGALVAAAGTHLVAVEEGVAAVGNVYTRRDRRGCGLASRLVGAVAGELLRRGVSTVALNVEQGNATAVRVYERLGFARYCAFAEGLAVRK
jgi:GNAT superfamily N-acetyltransferase